VARSRLELPAPSEKTLPDLGNGSLSHASSSVELTVALAGIGDDQGFVAPTTDST
jgi:hypothetical protein